MSANDKPSVGQQESKATSQASPKIDDIYDLKALLEDCDQKCTQLVKQANTSLKSVVDSDVLQRAVRLSWFTSSRSLDDEKNSPPHMIIWRKSLKVGSLLDFRHQYNSNVYRAEVLSVSQDGTELLLRSLQPVPSKLDYFWVHRWSTFLLPFCLASCQEFMMPLVGMLERQRATMRKIMSVLPGKGHNTQRLTSQLSPQQQSEITNIYEQFDTMFMPHELRRKRKQRYRRVMLQIVEYFREYRDSLVQEFPQLQQVSCDAYRAHIMSDERALLGFDIELLARLSCVEIALVDLAPSDFGLKFFGARRFTTYRLTLYRRRVEGLEGKLHVLNLAPGRRILPGDLQAADQLTKCLYNTAMRHSGDLQKLEYDHRSQQSEPSLLALARTAATTALLDRLLLHAATQGLIHLSRLLVSWIKPTSFQLRLLMHAVENSGHYKSAEIIRLLSKLEPSADAKQAFLSPDAKEQQQQAESKSFDNNPTSPVQQDYPLPQFRAPGTRGFPFFATELTGLSRYMATMQAWADAQDRDPESAGSWPDRVYPPRPRLPPGFIALVPLIQQNVAAEVFEEKLKSVLQAIQTPPEETKQEGATPPADQTVKPVQECDVMHGTVVDGRISLNESLSQLLLRAANVPNSNTLPVLLKSDYFRSVNYCRTTVSTELVSWHNSRLVLESGRCAFSASDLVRLKKFTQHVHVWNGDSLHNPDEGLYYRKVWGLQFRLKNAFSSLEGLQTACKLMPRDDLHELACDVAGISRHLRLDAWTRQSISQQLELRSVFYRIALYPQLWQQLAIMLCGWDSMLATMETTNATVSTTLQEAVSYRCDRRVIRVVLQYLHGFMLMD